MALEVCMDELANPDGDKDKDKDKDKQQCQWTLRNGKLQLILLLFLNHIRNTKGGVYTNWKKSWSCMS